MTKNKFDLIAVVIVIFSVILVTPYQECRGEHLQLCIFYDWYPFFTTFTNYRIRIDFQRLFMQEAILLLLIFFVRKYKYSRS